MRYGALSQRRRHGENLTIWGSDGDVRYDSLTDIHLTLAAETGERREEPPPFHTGGTTWDHSMGLC